MASRVSGSLSSVAAGTPVLNTEPGWLTFSIWGTFTATIVLEKSYDGGSTWISVSLPNTQTKISLTSENTVRVYEAEYNVRYRANCTAYTSGTANYRIGW